MTVIALDTNVKAGASHFFISISMFINQLVILEDIRIKFTQIVYFLNLKLIII